MPHVPQVRRLTIVASPRVARLLGVARFGLLALVSVGIAHDAVFAAEHGFGAGFAAAMSAGGHDGYWPAFSVAVVIALTLLGCWAVIRVGRSLASGSDDGRTGVAAPIVTGCRTYGEELRGLWLRLLALTATAFTLQENVEHLVGHGHIIGIGALTGPEYPLALPVIAGVTLVIAALGALVRWRLAVLEARLAGRIHQPRQRGHAARRPAPTWAVVAALRLRTLFLVRPDAGRAPPTPT